MLRITDNITVYCNICKKFLTITDSGSFHKYVKCPVCGHSIIKPDEKIRLKILSSRNAGLDLKLVEDIVEISEPYLKQKSEGELWNYHNLLTNINIKGAKEQAELIMDILNYSDRKNQIQKEKELARHIVEHNVSLFERYDLERLLKYKKILEKYKELDKNNRLRLIIELIIKKDKTGEYAKECEIELVEEIVNMSIYQLVKLEVVVLESYKKYLDKSKIKGSKEQSKEIEEIIKRKMEEKHE